MSKYNAKKVVYDGIEFDSRKECKRYIELKKLQDDGVITDLELQRKFVLIPLQREECNEIITKGKNKNCFKKGKVLERECAYFADFYYIKDGKIVVEDTKGYRRGGAYTVFTIKRKLMLYNYGIKVVEV